MLLAINKKVFHENMVVFLLEIQFKKTLSNSLKQNVMSFDESKFPQIIINIPYSYLIIR